MAENCNHDCASCGEECASREVPENCTHDCSTCGENCPSKTKSLKDFLEAPHEMSSVRKIIAVASGKGGVGKSLVTSLLAVSMSRLGYRVGILDSDITGPSIPRAFGVHDRAMSDEAGIYPAETQTGIHVISANMLLEEETAPVIWRGPMIAGVVKQFWTDVIWNDIDFLFVDMPPGTGDVPITVFQSIPVDGVVVVASPQELVGMVVEKALNMTNVMQVNVIGLVENMSYVECPDCHKKIKIFGESHIDRIGEEFNLPVLAKMPIDPQLAQLCDEGEIEKAPADYLTEACQKIVEYCDKED